MNVTDEDVRDYVRKMVQWWPQWMRDAALHELLPKSEVGVRQCCEHLPKGVQWIWMEGYEAGQRALVKGEVESVE